MNCIRAEELISRRLDGALGEREARELRRHLAGCPACIDRARAFATQDALLTHAWPHSRAPVGFGDAVRTALPPRAPVRVLPRRGGRLVTAPRFALAAALVLTLTGLVAAPPVRGTLAPALRHLFLNERAAREPERLLPVQNVTLAQARALVDWRIRLPERLPPGYRLVAVSVGELHSFAIGPSVILHYQIGDGPQAPELAILELRASGRAGEPVAPGASSAVTVGEHAARIIDGEWAEENGQTVWRRGTMLRLVLEDGDLLIQLQADPRDGWSAERLIDVAASLQ